MILSGRLSLKATLLLLWSLPLLAGALLLGCRYLAVLQGWETLGFALLGLTLLAGPPAIHFLLADTQRSLASLTDVARAVGSGNYARRVRTLLPPDFEQAARAINAMADNVGHTVASLVAQEQEIRAVLNGMREGVMVLDHRCRIRRVNKAMERILPGIGARLGRSPLELLPSPELVDACARMVSSNDREPDSLLVVLDERHIYEVNVLRASEAADIGSIAVFHDVSEIKRLESIRRDFAANVSHELRTPLTSIKGYAETLLGDMAPPPKMAEKFLRVILRNADHMSKMIGDLLSLARLEAGSELAGTSPRTGGPMDVRTSLGQAWESIRTMAAARKVELQDEMPACLPRVVGDEDQVGQVFRNLLENAVKFGPEARPVLVRAREHDGFAEITVRDFGPGIPRKDQDRVFERFYSVEKHRRNEYGSTGLGLAITRHIVHNHGGAIRVESPPAGHLEGTAFIFTLPLA